MNPQHSVLKRRTKSSDLHKVNRATNNMKKTILYLFAAVLLGLLITIVPVITLARVTTTPITNGHQTSFGKSLKQLEGGEGTPNSIISNSQVTALAICFIIAMVAYAIIGPKAPRRYNMRLGVPPY